MRAFKIDEISAVDRPAQEGARAVIMKRGDAPDGLMSPEEAERREAARPTARRKRELELRREELGKELQDLLLAGGEAEAIEALEGEVAELEVEIERARSEGAMGKADAGPLAIMRECEDEIDRLADVCKRAGETREQATDRLAAERHPLLASMVRTRDAAYEAAVARTNPSMQPGPVARATKAATTDAGMARVESELDTLAKRHAEATGEPPAEAYAAALDSPEGRRLYAEYSNAMEAAARA